MATDPGVRFEREKLVKQEEWEDEDMGICEDIRTFRILKEIGDTIFKCMKFTFDCPSLQPSKGQNEERVPVLDLKWGSSLSTSTLRSKQHAGTQYLTALPTVTK